MDYVEDENETVKIIDILGDDVKGEKILGHFNLFSNKKCKDIWGLTLEGTVEEDWSNGEYLFEFDGGIKNEKMLQMMDEYLLNLRWYPLYGLKT
jgi:hypothetical protein